MDQTIGYKKPQGEILGKGELEETNMQKLAIAFLFVALLISGPAYAHNGNSYGSEAGLTQEQASAAVGLSTAQGMWGQGHWKPLFKLQDLCKFRFCVGSDLRLSDRWLF